jgi:hypothetical protein
MSVRPFHRNSSCAPYHAVVGFSPERGAVTARARELVRFARQQGYQREELIQMIESLR